MKQRNLVCEPQAVYNLKGDAARIEFINRFKEVQRLKTQRDQYTDIDEAQEQTINAILPEDELRSLRASYLETAQRLKAQQGNVEAIAEFGGNKKVRRGDIAYNMMRMWQGAFGVAKEDCMVSPAYVVFSPESDTCPDFFGYLFKLPKYLQLLTSHSQGLTLDRLRLYYKDFARISVLIPSPLEQQEIANCLASLDDLLTAQTQKLAALKTHKKGLMQQIFPGLARQPVPRQVDKVPA